MLRKNIKQVLATKINDWINSVDNLYIQHLIMENAIITGGSIVSLLLDEKPHDYDVYFRNINALKQVAQYYADKYIKLDSKLCNIYKPEVQQCYWNEDAQGWTVLKDWERPNDKEIRIRVFVKSAGAVGESQSEKDNFARMTKIIGEEIKRDAIQVEPNSYTPIFMSANAITLSDNVQIILRFYGEPEEIHKNYDFVHCTCSYDYCNNKLTLPKRALEAIINKELYYIGSKYPLCSLIRLRKFLSRGWKVNAGQIVKIALQLNDINLRNLHVFEEQLIGVDSFYFEQVIRAVQQIQKKNPNFVPDTTYLIRLINEVFD